MNVSSTSLATSSSIALATAADSSASTKTTPAAPSAAASLASLLQASAASQASSAASSRPARNPALDVTKTLKAIGKALIAIMLITDPVQRAKAAADLYKHISQVAKNYAGAAGEAPATSNAQDAASGASQSADDDAAPATTSSAATTSQQIDAAPQTSSTTAAATGPADSNTSASSTASTAPAAASATAAPTANSATTATAAATPAVASTGPASGFVPDVYMEEIKSFANAAKQIYEAAVQEARQKHADTSKLKGTADEMHDAQDTLAQAAQAVEGPAATADGYSPIGAALSSQAPIVNVTA